MNRRLLPQSTAALLALLALPGPASAEDRIAPSATPRRLTTPGQPIDLPKSASLRAETFLDALIHQTPESAFFKLFEGSSLAQDPEVTKKFIDATRESSLEFGGFKSWNFLDARRPAERLLSLRYFCEMEKKLLEWRFVFFNPGGTDWVLANLKVDDFRDRLASDPARENPPGTVQLSVEKFFVSLQSGAIDAAFDQFFAGSELPEDVGRRSLLKKLAADAFKEYGALRAYDLHENLPLNPRFHLVTYFSYHDTEPLRWQFFYRVAPDGSWILVNLRLDDLLDEALLL